MCLRVDDILYMHATSQLLAFTTCLTLLTPRRCMNFVLSTLPLTQYIRIVAQSHALKLHLKTLPFYLRSSLLFPWHLRHRHMLLHRPLSLHDETVCSCPQVHLRDYRERNQGTPWLVSCQPHLLTYSVHTCRSMLIKIKLEL